MSFFVTELPAITTNIHIITRNAREIIPCEQEGHVKPHSRAYSPLNRNLISSAPKPTSVAEADCGHPQVSMP